MIQNSILKAFFIISLLLPSITTSYGTVPSSNATKDMGRKDLKVMK